MLASYLDCHRRRVRPALCGLLRLLVSGSLLPSTGTHPYPAPVGVSFSICKLSVLF